MKKHSKPLTIELNINLIKSIGNRPILFKVH